MNAETDAFLLETPNMAKLGPADIANIARQIYSGSP